MNGLGGIVYSSEIPLIGVVGAVTTLTLDLISFGIIPATSTLFVGIGIIFDQEINGDFYELAQGNAMKLSVVGYFFLKS